MPTSPSNERPLSASSTSSGISPRLRSARARTRYPSAAYRSAIGSARSHVSRSSGLPSGASASKAPLTATHTRPRSWWSVDMRRRDASKAISASRGCLASRSRRLMPSFPARASNAPSVGSPEMVHGSPCRGGPWRTASLQAAATRPIRWRNGSSDGSASPTMDPSGSYPVPATRYSASGVQTRSTSIRFWVRVPVLSEQTTLTEPSVSTAGSFRTRARRPAMR